MYVYVCLHYASLLTSFQCHCPVTLSSRYRVCCLWWHLLDLSQHTSNIKVHTCVCTQMMKVVEAISVYNSYVLICRNWYVRIIYVCTYAHTYILTPILCKLEFYFVPTSECGSSLHYWSNEEFHSHDKLIETGSFRFEINSGDNGSEAGSEQSNTACPSPNPVRQDYPGQSPFLNMYRSYIYVDNTTPRNIWKV